MANDEIDDKIFVTILCIRKNNNREDLDSIYKENKKINNKKIFRLWRCHQRIS